MKKANGNNQQIIKENWAIQSSGQIRAKGGEISMLDYSVNGWYKVTFPTTVLAGLVENNVYPDPYFGTNIQNIPGYIEGKFTKMPDDSPFNVAWWYRTTFNIPADYANKNIRIKFNGINYKANIWLNGNLIADTTDVEGPYRLYSFDVTKYAYPGSNNSLALEIFPPKGMDLTISWVDWNPVPPDAGMGIWYDVVLSATGDVSIENPHVITDLDLPAIDKANLTISAELKNNGNKQIKGVLIGQIENVEFVQNVTLMPDEVKSVTFTPDKFRQLQLKNPRLWWPHTVGPQNLYNLTLSFKTTEGISDIKETRFGVREISSWMNEFDGKRTRVFQINGKNIVIRGGGYVQDMMLRPSDERVDIDIQYAKHMNLNALRMEAPRGSDYLYEKCDEEGILLIVGWCCCSPWEQWSEWNSHTTGIAQKSWHDQIIHLRNHPSIFNWLYGSDFFPPEEIEKKYIYELEKYDNTRPYQSSATREASVIAGYTGLEMGPFRKGYAYMPPKYWYNKLEFNTEAGPGGEQLPPIETLKKMMPEAEMWPISKSWYLRLHEAFYPGARSALNSRYGEPQNLEDYIKKSQVLQLEAIKAMFEAYAGNKYKSSGIIFWMYNSAWPSMYWQLYDYFYNPNGGFYGTKKACENLHIQYAYDDNSVQIVNGNYHSYSQLNASVKLYNINMEEKLSRVVQTSIGSDESKKILKIAPPVDITDVYFLHLKLTDSESKEVSSNFYWLSVKGDEKADFKLLNNLPWVQLKCKLKTSSVNKDKNILVFEFENPTSCLAFSVNPKLILKNTEEPLLPVFWGDNYFSLLPNEKKDVSVEFSTKVVGDNPLLLKIEGWNINKETIQIK
ncbi:MAG: hypothetical protein VB102_05220 [Paludibacter sp.]|nr:hypothetical protein [Paludibacter sp.]